MGLGRAGMKVAADTNLLVRVADRDDDRQARKALEILSGAEIVAISIPCLCEFVWVLDKFYRCSRPDIAIAVRHLITRSNTRCDENAVVAGLRVLDVGGDFADGAIAAAGLSMGAEKFVSFDRRAVDRVRAAGMPARHADSIA